MFCKFLFFGQGQSLLILTTSREFLTLILYLVKIYITSVMCTCWHGCLPVKNKIPNFGCTFWCPGVGHFLIPTTKPLISRTPIVCSRIQFWHQLSRVQSLRTQFHKAAPTSISSDTHHKSWNLYTFDWLVTNQVFPWSSL